MIGVALKGLLGRKLRAALTAFAIVLGVSMISGSFILTDTLGKTFDGIFEESYQDTDAVISSKEAIGTADDTDDAPAFDAALLRNVEALPEVRVAQGSIEDEARLVDDDGEPIGKADDAVAIAVDPDADQALNPLQLVSGTWPRARRRSRSTSRPRRSRASRSGRPSARSRTGPSVGTRSAASSATAASTRSAAPRSPSSTCRRRRACSARPASWT